MPKIVDHAERRAQIVRALLEIAARDGHERVSSRAVAQELGIATGALWHYFPNFDSVVRAGAEEVTRRTMSRIERAGEGRRGLDRLNAVMREVFPFEPGTRTEARVVVGFWGRLASREPDRTAPTGAAWMRHVHEALEEAVADGELRADTPIADVALILHSASYGQQVMDVVEAPSPEVHDRILGATLAAWRT